MASFDRMDSKLHLNLNAQLLIMNKKKIIRHTVDELIGKGNLEIIDKTFSTDYIAHAGEKEFKGHAFIKRFITQLYTSLPDLQVLKVEFFTDDIEKIT